MEGEPLMITSDPTPGQSPIPVVIIEHGHEGLVAWSAEWWVTVSGFAVAGVTLLTIIHMDVVLHHLVSLVKAMTPTRRTLRGKVTSHDPGNTPESTPDKAIKPRV